MDVPLQITAAHPDFCGLNGLSEPSVYTRVCTGWSDRVFARESHPQNSSSDESRGGMSCSMRNSTKSGEGNLEITFLGGEG